MLSTYLTTVPPIKFVLIEDCVAAKGRDFLDFLIEHHAKASRRTHLFVFEGCYERSRAKYGPKVTQCHDCTNATTNTIQESLESTEKCVYIIDSVAQLIFQKDVAGACRIINDLVKNHPHIQQIVGVLHRDLLEEPHSAKYFTFLANIHLNVLSYGHVAYRYTKSPGKIMNRIEEYSFYSNTNQLITQPVKKIDKNRFNQTINEILPENLTTFKISLSDKEKDSRDNLVLPYLPKSNEEGNIQYKFDAVDDWDEEDPDDDLDI